MIKFLNGKKTYICAILAALGGLGVFISHGDFSIPAILSFVNSEAVVGAIAALRAAKK